MAATGLQDPDDTSSLKSDWVCTFCQKRYSKREHLDRHERTHTGERPFSCLQCRRSFARQDALKRHARVHRNGSSRSDLQPSSSHFHSSPSTSTIGEASSIQSSSMTQDTSPTSQMHSDGSVISVQDQPVPLQVPFQEPEDTQHYQPYTQNVDPTGLGGRNDIANNGSLIWPDSEDLLHTIMALNPMLWEQPIAFMPPMHDPFLAMPSDNSSVQNTDISSQQPHTESSYGAIQTLNGLIKNTVSNVTASTASSDLTPKFLDSCLHMFFTTFIPMFPVLHRPTFVFKDCSAPLLLNAIALGSLYLGTTDAGPKGEALWRLAHTAIATSWHTMITYRKESNICDGTQLVLSALLSQVYATLSKNRTLRMTSQIFHGLGFYWARYCGMFDTIENHDLPSPSSPADVKLRAWHAWAARETQLRALLGLYIMDGVIAQFSGNPTFAQHMSNPLCIPSSEAAFEATNPNSWLRAMGSQRDQQIRFHDTFCSLFSASGQLPNLENTSSTFYIKILLEGVRSLVYQSYRRESSPIGLPVKTEISRVLAKLREYIDTTHTLSPIDKAIALLRWHAICLDTVSDTARGTRRLCYQFNITQQIFGGGLREERNIDPPRWLTSHVARRALLHASMIQEIASQLPLGSAHNIYIPGAVFAAATTYAAFAMAGASRVVMPTHIDWQSVVRLDLNLTAHGEGMGLNDGIRDTLNYLAGTFAVDEKLGYGSNGITRNLAYDLSSVQILLRGLSTQWGVAGEMEQVVQAWISRC